MCASFPLIGASCLCCCAFQVEGGVRGCRADWVGVPRGSLPGFIGAVVQPATHGSKRARRSPRGTRPTCHRGPAQRPTCPLQPLLSPFSHVHCISQSRSSSWNALLVLLRPQPTFRDLLHDPCLFPRPVPAARSHSPLCVLLGWLLKCAALRCCLFMRLTSLSAPVPSRRTFCGDGRRPVQSPPATRGH